MSLDIQAQPRPPQIPPVEAPVYAQERHRIIVTEEGPNHPQPLQPVNRDLMIDVPPIEGAPADVRGRYEEHVEEVMQRRAEAEMSMLGRQRARVAEWIAVRLPFRRQPAPDEIVPIPNSVFSKLGDETVFIPREHPASRPMVPEEVASHRIDVAANLSPSPSIFVKRQEAAARDSQLFQGNGVAPFGQFVDFAASVEKSRPKKEKNYPPRAA